MEPIITIILFAAALFVLFLMLTSGHRKHKLNKVLNDLQTERMRLLKSIEHVKLSFYQRKIGEKEAQDKIFEYEEKLRSIESKILEIKEKPLMKTVKKQEEKESKEERETDEATEEGEVERTEARMVKHMDAKTIVALLVLLIFGVIVAMSLVGPTLEESEGTVAKEPIVIGINARTVPEGGTPPGSSAGLRVELENTHDRPLENIYVWARAPEGSGIRFKDGNIGVKTIDYLDTGGTRDLFFNINVDKEASEGEYVLSVDAVDDDNLNTTATAKLPVKIGKPEGDEEIPITTSDNYD